MKIVFSKQVEYWGWNSKFVLKNQERNKLKDIKSEQIMGSATAVH